MPSDNWERVQSLFFSLADLPPTERARLLDKECDGDPALREEIESLLHSDLKRGKTIRTAVLGEVSIMFDPRALIGERLGSYRIIKEIGRGGMGEVYLAIRDDDHYQKNVAIKLIKRGMDTEEVLRRFRDERQILANLDHSYIARLIDGGATPNAQPFLVMEFIEGRPIDQYCRELNLCIEARCTLFLKTCEAVSHAHRNLVVHRDLKPENILITADGSPKLLDFGVAKILESEQDHGVTRTGYGRALTPEYASPEQMRGEAVSTATDIYSLGVIFHQLLTGAKPNRFPSSNPSEWERILREEEIVPPSAETGDVRLARRLRGDLDNIALMAMRKEAHRRYASVQQFGEDVQRYLSCLPVLARQDSWTYRTAKFARRRRYALLAGACVVISLIAGTVISLSQAHQANLARQAAEMHRENAEHERAKAEEQERVADQARIAAEGEHRIAELQRDVAVTEKTRSHERLTQMVGLSDRSLAQVYSLMERLPGAVPARKELLETALDFLKQLSREAGPEPRLTLALATGYLRLADLEGDPDVANLGAFDAALASYRAGSALLDPAIRQLEPAELLVWVDLQQGIGKILTEKGDPQGAVRILLSALHATQVSRSTQPDIVRRRTNLYLSLARTDNDLHESLRYGTEYLREIEVRSKELPGDADVQSDLSMAYTEIGWQMVSLGDPEAGIQQHEKSMQIRERLVRDHPNDDFYRRYLMLAYEHFGTVQGSPLVPNLGRPDIARTYYEKARPLEESSRADPQNHLSESDYAAFLMKSAVLEVPPEAWAESLETLRTAAAMFESLSLRARGLLRYQRDLAATYMFMGQRYTQMGEYPEALVQFRHSLAIGDKILAAFPRDWLAIERAVTAHRQLLDTTALSGDGPATLNEAGRLLIRAKQASRNDAGSAWLRTAIAGAYVSAATVYQGIEHWDNSREAAQDAIATLTSSASIHRGALDTKLLRDAQAILAHSSSHR